MLFQPYAPEECHRHFFDIQDFAINSLALIIAHDVAYVMGMDLYDGPNDPIAPIMAKYVNLTYTPPIPGRAVSVNADSRPDLEWLLPKNDPISPNDYKLSLKQEEKLIELHSIEKAAKIDFSAISIGSKDNRFYQALERRGLLEMVDSEVVGRKHKMYWKLTSAGRGTAVNLTDLPF